MELPTYKILVAILHQGYIRPELAQAASVMKNDKRANVEILYTSKRPSENNRNYTVKYALENGFDYLISIDHDIVPLKNPIDLVFLGKDIIGFACPQWNMTCPEFPIYFVGMDKAEGGYTEHKDRNGMQKVDAVGSGCLVVSRKAMEIIKEPFVRKFEDGFAVTGLDFYFCEKAIEAGLDVFCHYDYVADHFKEVSLLDVLRFKNS